MSTRKDAVKRSTSNVPKEKVPGAAKASTRKRDDSKDRGDAKKAEMPNKSIKSTAPLRDGREKPVENNRLKTKPLKTVSKAETAVKVPNKPPKEIKKVTTTTPKAVPKKSSKPEVPRTPTSSRVSKTQFFPSKHMYANALNAAASRSVSVARSDQDVKETKIREVKPKKIVKPQAKEKSIRSRLKESIRSKEVSSDSSISVSERPSTATLRKGSIVNDNIAGPDAPLIPKPIKEGVELAKTSSPKSASSDDSKYEDDFESYESDFEEYSSSSSTNVDNISGEETSSVSSSSSSLSSPRELKSTPNRISSAGTDEERKLDSGNFDLPDYKRKQILHNIKESIEKENANLTMQEIQRNNPASLSDEGFEDQKSLQFINFLDAKKKYVHRKSLEMKRKRGEEILNMIRLDTYSFTLFDMPPVPYEDFIKTFGKSNSVQTAIQTGEDDVSEEVQTDEIVNDSKWTQYPVSFSKMDMEDPNFWQIYKSDCLGVGSEKIDTRKVSEKSFNENQLNKFLLSASSLILKIQSESYSDNFKNIRKNSRDLPFSDGYIMFNTSKEIFSNCSIKCVAFCCDNNNKVMTVHLRKKGDYECGSVVCIWNISNPEEHDFILISYGEVSCCSFGLSSSELIYAGLNDGTISLWNTKKMFNKLPLSQIPSYTTEICQGHESRIVALQPFINSTEKALGFTSAKTNEICSLDDEGNMVLWSVIMKESSSNITVFTSATKWSDIVLVKNTRVALKAIYPDLVDLQCTDFVINKADSNFVFVSTNYGFIIHHLLKGGKSNVKKFLPESRAAANCLEICPFSPNYFLAGFGDGNISLYSRLVEKPLIVLSDKDGKTEECSIQLLQWSRNKPFVFYTKDISNTIHIWDLSESDIFPTYSVPFVNNITCMKLSPLMMENSLKKSYLMIGTEDGDLYLHQLNSDHGQQPVDMYEEHVSTFLKYVNRL